MLVNASAIVAQVAHTTIERESASIIDVQRKIGTAANSEISIQRVAPRNCPAYGGVIEGDRIQRRGPVDGGAIEGSGIQSGTDNGVGKSSVSKNGGARKAWVPGEGGGGDSAADV